MIDILFSPNKSGGKSTDERLRRINDYLNSESELYLSLPPRYIDEYGVKFMDYSNLAIGSRSIFALDTYTEVAALEVAMAIENGADYIEILLDHNNFTEQHDDSLSQIKLIAEEIADDALLWVVLESENFENFKLYEDAIISLIACGVKGIVLNTTCKSKSDIKFLDQTIKLSSELEQSFSIKIFCDSIEPEISKYESIITRIEI